TLVVAERHDEFANGLRQPLDPRYRFADIGHLLAHEGLEVRTVLPAWTDVDQVFDRIARDPELQHHGFARVAGAGGAFAAVDGVDVTHLFLGCAIEGRAVVVAGAGPALGDDPLLLHRGKPGFGRSVEEHEIVGARWGCRRFRPGGCRRRCRCGCRCRLTDRPE